MNICHELTNIILHQDYTKNCPIARNSNGISSTSPTYNNYRINVIKENYGDPNLIHLPNDGAIVETFKLLAFRSKVNID